MKKRKRLDYIDTNDINIKNLSENLNENNQYAFNKLNDINNLIKYEDNLKKIKLSEIESLDLLEIETDLKTREKESKNYNYIISKIANSIFINFGKLKKDTYIQEQYYIFLLLLFIDSFTHYFCDYTAHFLWRVFLESPNNLNPSIIKKFYDIINSGFSIDEKNFAINILKDSNIEKIEFTDKEKARILYDSFEYYNKYKYLLNNENITNKNNNNNKNEIIDEVDEIINNLNIIKNLPINISSLFNCNFIENTTTFNYDRNNKHFFQNIINETKNNFNLLLEDNYNSKENLVDDFNYYLYNTVIFTLDQIYNKYIDIYISLGIIDFIKYGFNDNNNNNGNNNGGDNSDKRILKFFNASPYGENFINCIKNQYEKLNNSKDGKYILNLIDTMDEVKISLIINYLLNMIKVENITIDNACIYIILLHELYNKLENKNDPIINFLIYYLPFDGRLFL